MILRMCPSGTFVSASPGQSAPTRLFRWPFYHAMISLPNFPAIGRTVVPPRSHLLATPLPLPTRRKPREGAGSRKQGVFRGKPYVARGAADKRSAMLVMFGGRVEPLSSLSRRKRRGCQKVGTHYAEQITRRAHPPSSLHRLPDWGGVFQWAPTPAKCAQCAQLHWSLAPGRSFCCNGGHWGGCQTIGRSPPLSTPPLLHSPLPLRREGKGEEELLPTTSAREAQRRRWVGKVINNSGTPLLGGEPLSLQQRSGHLQQTTTTTTT
ncbi:hypothetical protein QBC34DRAFT_144986 [Podospora aff. communis PSN243]|uniref:Uncharacterized protein n=1 Tax=Podospora aff. communis PSN243 TaxID=3040156 RepID=A0AAV9GI42_9PEZI|nr:hypothetical protein QBC34DRAFT_144986 [Podospora aff. communis PSN243]